MPTPPASQRVSRARWLRTVLVVANAGLEPGWTKTTVAVARQLASHMSATGGSCFPGIVTLARELSPPSKPSTVVKHLRLLERGGYLEVDRGGGRGRRTGYFSRLPVDLEVDQAGWRPARAWAWRAPAARPLLQLVGEGAEQLAGETQAHNAVAGDGDVVLVVNEAAEEASVPTARPRLELAGEPAGAEGLQAPPPAAAEGAGERAGEQLGAETPDLASDVDLAAREAPMTPPSSQVMTGGDGTQGDQGLGRKTHPVGRSGGEGGSQPPSRQPGNPGGDQARSGGTRPTPRTIHPARVPAPVAAVIGALPLSEQQRGWVRTWQEAVAKIDQALRTSGASPTELAAAIVGAREWPLHRGAKSLGGVVASRIPGALELLAIRRSATAHARELGAAPPPAAAEASTPARPEVVRAAAAAARAAVAAATCPLHPEGCPVSPQPSAPRETTSRPGSVPAAPAPGDPEWAAAWGPLLADQAVTVDGDGYLRVG